MQAFPDALPWRLFGAALVFCLAIDPVTGQQDKRHWSRRFPEVAARVRHLDKRLASTDESVRLGVLTELTYFQPRDSRVYPPFLRALLRDPSPKIRWEALHRLWEHQLLDRKEVPASFEAPLVGMVVGQDPKHLNRLRELAKTLDATGGWAIHILGILGDREAMPLARAALQSQNVFTRFSAAVALVRLGERQEGVDALHKITDAADDQTDFYRCRAAEVLYRLGDRKAALVLIQVLEKGMRAAYAYGPVELLEDLTGQYFTTAAEWRTWWQASEKKAQPKRRTGGAGRR
jgi:HEAT repeat protein